VASFDVTIQEKATFANTNVLLTQCNTTPYSQGNVKWFDADKGFGFIQPSSPTSSDVFVHHTGICTDGGFRALTEGESVEYEVEEQDDGRVKVSARKSVMGRKHIACR